MTAPTVDAFDGLVRQGETPARAVERIERRRDYHQLIASDAGQRLLEAAAHEHRGERAPEDDEG